MGKLKVTTTQIEGSSTLKTVAYHHQEGKLVVTFTSGANYEYYNVPSKIWQGLLDAESKGTFFSLHIRSSFKYQKL